MLEQVAREAGYTRGALYHQFTGKEDLALAVLEWVDETWRREVGAPVERESDPVAALIALARGHAVFCRRDVARVAMALRLEFSGQDHPVGARARARLGGAGQALRPPDQRRPQSRGDPARPARHGRSRWRSSERSRAP